MAGSRGSASTSAGCSIESWPSARAGSPWCGSERRPSTRTSAQPSLGRVTAHPDIRASPSPPHDEPGCRPRVASCARARAARDGPQVGGGNIADGSDEASGRGIPGHWEGNLVVDDLPGCPVTLADCGTRVVRMPGPSAHDSDAAGARSPLSSPTRGTSLTPSAHDSNAAETKPGRMAAGIPAMLRRTVAWG